MTIAEIYRQYGIAPNLQKHTLTVAKVVEVIEQNWKGPVLSWKDLEIAALLHDVGNLVKFDFDKFPELLGNEQSNIETWKQAQQRFINRFGIDDHQATAAMLAELGISDRIRDLIFSKSFANTIQVANSYDWPGKILAYADLRVLPQGIGSLDDRVADIKKRMPKYTQREDFPELVAAAYRIETQIAGQVKITLQEIGRDEEKIAAETLLLRSVTTLK